jgi:hypothetical protein
MISPIDTEDDRIIGVKLQLQSDYTIYIFQVYIPCKNHGTEVFKTYIEKIENIFFNYCDKGIVIVMGDFNAEIMYNAPRNVFFTDTLKRNNIVSLNYNILGDTSTNYSYNSNLSTTIDHVLIQMEKQYLFSKCIIPADNALNVSSHRPIIYSLNVPLDNVHLNQDNGCYINWSNVTQDQINNYVTYISNYMQNIDCVNENVISTDQIDNLYNLIVSLTNKANSICFPVAKFKPFLKPYWDIELKNACKISKALRRKWIIDGKPRGNDSKSYKDYKNAKREYRKIHLHKVDQYLIRLHEEIDNYAEVDSKMFWKCINRRRSKSRSSVGNEIIFNNVVYKDQKQVNTQWAQYFQQLYSPTLSEE